MDLWQYLKTTDKPIALYGIGNGADKIISVLQSYGIKMAGVFATDGFVRDKYFHDFKLISYTEMKEKLGDMIVLLCFGSGRPEVLDSILKLSTEQELYAPDVPVYGDGLFNTEYAQANADNLRYIYSLLADEKSKQTFENVVKYKLSGNVKYLFDCAVEENEPYESFLKLSNNECFLDLGAYNGDTVNDFISRTNSYKSIVAVEPDIKTFRKLKLNTENIKNISLINACITDHTGTSNFSMRGGRNSTVGLGEEIRACTVDEIGSNSTFIKMDIEGEETKAIKGAYNTILNNKPKMQIACYHRVEDIFSIPKDILNIRKDYKLYLRRFKCLPAWDLNFYFI